MGARNHAVDDEKDALGKSEVRRGNQVRGVDPRRKVAATGVSRAARRQEADGSGARVSVEICLGLNKTNNVFSLSEVEGSLLLA